MCVSYKLLIAKRLNYLFNLLANYLLNLSIYITIRLIQQYYWPPSLQVLEFHITSSILIVCLLILGTQSQKISENP